MKRLRPFWKAIRTASPCFLRNKRPRLAILAATDEWIQTSWWYSSFKKRFAALAASKVTSSSLSSSPAIEFKRASHSSTNHFTKYVVVDPLLHAPWGKSELDSQESFACVILLRYGCTLFVLHHLSNKPLTALILSTMEPWKWWLVANTTMADAIKVFPHPRCQVWKRS